MAEWGQWDRITRGPDNEETLVAGPRNANWCCPDRLRRTAVLTPSQPVKIRESWHEYSLSVRESDQATMTDVREFPVRGRLPSRQSWRWRGRSTSEGGLAPPRHPLDALLLPQAWACETVVMMQKTIVRIFTAVLLDRSVEW